MALSRLDAAAATFNSRSENLHDRFLEILDDSECAGCRSSGFGEAILAAWLQTAWGKFIRDLIVASALGTRRRRGTSVKAISGVRSRRDAERMVKAAASCAAGKRGTPYPVWHDPSFAIDVGTLLGLENLPRLEIALGVTRVPRHITDFRNYLIHPADDTLQKYKDLQAKLGVHRIEPEDLLHQLQQPGLRIFTSWVRELQRIADQSTL